MASVVPQKKLIFYNDGSLDDTCIIDDPRGDKDLTQVEVYVGSNDKFYEKYSIDSADKKHGKYICYFEPDDNNTNRIFMDKTYRHDVQIGDYYGYYDNGKKYIHKKFNDSGIPTYLKSWHRNGNIRLECEFTEYGWVASERYYDESGQFENHFEYERDASGKFINERVLDKSGNIVNTKHYDD